MTNTKDIILKLKEVRKEKGLSYNDILKLMEKNGDYLSKSTISKVFSEGSEASSFRYEETIRPIAKALLDIEHIEEDDNVDVQAMKSLLKYKIKRIEELEQQIELLQAEMAKERTQQSKSIAFLKEQVAFKDKRIDVLLDSVQAKDSRYDELLSLVLSCPCRQQQKRREKHEAD